MAHTLSLPALLFASLLAGPGALVLACRLLRLPEERFQRLALRLQALTSGALLGAVLLRALPAALEELTTVSVLVTMLVSVLAFHGAERLRVLRNCRQFRCTEYEEMSSQVFLGDASHSLLSGIGLATAFHAGGALGWIMSLVLLVHEIPRYGVNLALLKGGKQNPVALIWNLASGAFTIAGALGSHVLMALFPSLAPHAVAAGTAFFLYLSFTGLTPRQQHRLELREAGLQVVLTGLGAGLLWLTPLCG